MVGHTQTHHPRGQEDRLTDWAGALTCLGVLSIDALCARAGRRGGGRPRFGAAAGSGRQRVLPEYDDYVTEVFGDPLPEGLTREED